MRRWAILEHHISGNVLSNEALRVFFTSEAIPEPSFQCGSDVASQQETQSWCGEPWAGRAGGFKTGPLAGLVLGKPGLGKWNMDVLKIQLSQMAGLICLEPCVNFAWMLSRTWVPFLGGPQISYCTWTHPFSSVGTTGSASLAELRLAHKSLLRIPWYNCLAHHGKKNQLRSIYSIFLFFR